MADNYLKELDQEYIKLNKLAGQVDDLRDHNCIMARINLFDFYTEYYLKTKYIMDYNQP
jgi:hypothetical protein